MLNKILFVLAVLAFWYLLMSIGIAFSRHDFYDIQQEIAALEETPIVLETGIASWYDYDLRTADQKCKPENYPCYSQVTATCASRDYARGSMLKITRVSDGTEVICRVNDYGPEEATGRAIDLSSYAFSKLALLKLGLVEVTIELVK